MDFEGFFGILRDFIASWANDTNECSETVNQI